MENYSDFEHINVGSGVEHTIMGTARMIAYVVGFEGNIDTDPAKLGGTPRKLMDSSKIFGMDWQPFVDLKKGLAASYQWFCRAGEQI